MEKDKNGITSRIKTFSDALIELGDEHIFVRSYKELLSISKGEDFRDDMFGADLIAYMKLRIICAALNEGWVPEFKEGENRYYPRFWFYTKNEISRMPDVCKRHIRIISTDKYNTEYDGFSHNLSNYYPSTFSIPQSHTLCLKSNNLAFYCGKQFVEIWADFLLSKK